MNDNVKRYPNCHMRTALGNCDPIGGFCTSINEFICEGLHKVSRANADWISITTSEPTTAHPVLVTYKWGDDYDDYEVRDLDYWVAKSAAEEGNEQGQMLIDHVIAWMPLPKPYKGDNSE